MDVAELCLLEEEKGFILMILIPNKALHRTAIRPRSIAAGDLGRWFSGKFDYKQGINMAVTLSSKSRVVIAEEAREKLQLRVGQKLTVIAKGRIVRLIPQRPLASFKGFLKELSSSCLREEHDR